MKKKLITTFCPIMAAVILMAGCSASGELSPGPSVNNSPLSAQTDSTAPGNETAETDTEIKVRFGDDGAPFVMHLYDNKTAAAIARYVGTADWRLPIYNYDESDVMEYYDIPSRYDIPSNPETITFAKAGEAYYSDPNRIILFYHDAEITGEYTRVGYFDATKEFVAAVENNPVLEGWDNKIVNISDRE